MKTKLKKVKKLNKLATEDTANTEIIETVKPIENIDIKAEVKIASFSGDFGRVDINLLRDKVNEIIEYINLK